MTSLRHDLNISESKRVLIIDDDLDLREAFDVAFRQEDYEVFSAKDGAEAMELLDRMREEELPDLIILDYQMPRMNGVTFSQLKARNHKLAHIPTVLLSASGDKVEVRENILADAFIEKPLDLNRLLELAHHFAFHGKSASKFSLKVGISFSAS